MSTLWTPGGEQDPPLDDTAAARGPTAGTGAEPGTEGDEEAAREQLRQLREQLAATPVADIVANHAIGLWELALLHLSPAEGHELDLEQAQLAIDAVGALVDGLGDRLGRHHQPLREALAQLRLAFVEISRRDESDAEAGTENG